MAKSTKLTFEGTIDESAIKKTGFLKGSGTVSIDIPDITKTSLTFDYKEKDNVKLRLKSEGPVTLSTDKALTLNGEVDYGFLNRTIGGNFGIEFVVSNKVAMDFGQTFGANGSKTSAKLTLKF